MIPADGGTVAGTVAVLFAALYVAHMIGDHWIQTDHQAHAKARRARDVGRVRYRDPDPTRNMLLAWHRDGWTACLAHVATHIAVALATVLLIQWRCDLQLEPTRIGAGLAVSAVTHAWADRRHTLAWLARRTGAGLFYARRADGINGAYLLDQSWHISWLLLAALVIA
jgi:hypothetical protein